MPHKLDYELEEEYEAELEADGEAELEQLLEQLDEAVYETVPAIGSTPQSSFGTLTAALPGRRPFSYQFTQEDALWTARFIVGEAGGKDTPENRAVIWAMFNRYAFFTHPHFPTFHQ